jgi:hypothetical protein
LKEQLEELAVSYGMINAEEFLMTKQVLFTAAALLAASAAVPAAAALHDMGSVNFSERDRHDARLGNFKAASLALVARGGDVLCNRVVATYGNGRTDEIFRGPLPEGQTVRVDIRDNSIDRVDFDCRPMDRGRASVEIAADDGHGSSYRDDGYGRDNDTYDRGDNERYTRGDSDGYGRGYDRDRSDDSRFGPYDR